MSSPTTFSQTVIDFAEGFIGMKPLFSNGVQIGNWSVGGGWFDTNAQDVMSSVCNQQVQLYPNVTAAQQDPTTWQTYDDWGRLIKVQDYCLQKQVVPNWMTADQAAAYSLQQAGGGIALPLAIAGGFLLLSFLLVRR